MSTTADLLNKLVSQKNTLADNLVEKGVEATHDETLKTLVPKVLDIIQGGDITAAGNPVQIDGLQGGVPFSEMVVSGKNLICISVGTDIRCTSNISDDTLTLTPSDMSATSSSYYFIAIPPMKKGKAVTISADFENSGGNKIQIAIWRGNTLIIASPLTNDINGNLKFSYFPDADYDNLLLLLYARSINSISNGNVVYSNLQMEYGTTATAYEPPITGRDLTLNVNGAEYTITPDSNPYVIPNDIRQVDGLNNISASAGTLSVTGVRKNAALKRVWNEIDDIKTAIIVSNGENE